MRRLSLFTLANFISEPVLKGFIIGLALTIMVGQLPKLFGEQGLAFHTEGRPVGRSMASKYVRLATRAAGLEQTSWHDFRHHHAASWMRPLAHQLRTS